MIYLVYDSIHLLFWQKHLELLCLTLCVFSKAFVAHNKYLTSLFLKDNDIISTKSAMVCFGIIPEREGSISPAYFYGWPSDYLSHVFALSAMVMDKFLCTWYCLSECRSYVDVNQVWSRVYVTTKRGMLFWMMVRW